MIDSRSMAADELQQLYTQGAIARRKINFVPAKKPTNPAPPAGVDILWLTPRPEVVTLLQTTSQLMLLRSEQR